MTKLEELIRFCYEHGGTLKAHKMFGQLQMEAVDEQTNLRERVSELETALKCASACNWTDKPWHKESDFQKKIERLVGNPPYGDDK